MESLISQAYTIFNYPIPTNISNVCTECCLSKDKARLLLSTTLKEIPLTLLQEYNDGAQAVQLDRNEFSYFLPRYLELLSQFQFTSAVDVSLSLKNLKFDCKDLWPKENEVQFINEFFKSFFLKFLKTKVFSETIEVIEVINMMHVSGIDISALLPLWLANLNNFSIVHLEQLISSNFNYRGKMHTNSFVASDLNCILESWIKSNKMVIVKAIEAHIMSSNLEETHLQKLSYLYDTVNYL